MPDSPSSHFWVAVPEEGGSLSPKAYRPDYVIDHATGCWIWQKRLTRGYGTGSFLSVGIKTNWAHRAYFIAANGPVEADEEIHHVCRNPRCVNPAHLERVTQRDHDVISFLGDRAGGLALDDVRAIRELGRTVGVRAKDVAEQYGIHEITVYNYWGQEPVWADLLDEAEVVCRPVRECRFCGVEFSHRKRHAVYCSKEHQDAANNQRIPTQPQSRPSGRRCSLRCGRSRTHRATVAWATCSRPT